MCFVPGRIAGPGLGEVGGHADAEPTRPRAPGLVEMDPAGLLVDDPARAGRRAGDREGVVSVQRVDFLECRSYA